MASSSSNTEKVEVNIKLAKSFTTKIYNFIFLILLEPGPRPSWEQKPAAKSTSSSSSSYTSSWRSKFTGKHILDVAPCSS